MGKHVLRTPGNSTRVCEMIAEGCSLRQVAQVIGLTEAAIRKWAKDDKEFGDHYAKAQQDRLEQMAEDLVALADADCTVGGVPDHALVQHRRLQIDTRRWLLSKMLPKQFGDKVTQELVGSSDAPIVTRIELIPVAPTPRLPRPSDDETDG